jgi:dCTP diphosphatase
MASAPAAAEPSDTAPLTLARLRSDLGAFADERDWAQFHTPRNLCLALVGEVGELAETFQWRADADCAPGLPTWSASDKAHLGEELSDVLLYVLRLADRCNVDLDAAVLQKLAANRAKYPAALCKGSSAKYTAYARGEDAAGAAAEEQQ